MADKDIMVKLPSIASIDEAAEIIQTLMAYGMISPIEAVIYPEGTHKEMLRKADEWLWNYRSSGRKLKIETIHYWEKNTKASK